MASISFERGEHIVPVVEKWLVNALTFVKYIVRNMAYTWSRNLESKEEKNQFIGFTVDTTERKTTVTLLSVSTATEILQWLTMTLRKSFFFCLQLFGALYISDFFYGSMVEKMVIWRNWTINHSDDGILEKLIVISMSIVPIIANRFIKRKRFLFRN